MMLLPALDFQTEVLPQGGGNLERDPRFPHRSEPSRPKPGLRCLCPRLRTGQADIAKLVVGVFAQSAATAAFFQAMPDSRQQPPAPACRPAHFRSICIARRFESLAHQSHLVFLSSTE